MQPTPVPEFTQSNQVTTFIRPSDQARPPPTSTTDVLKGKRRDKNMRGEDYDSCNIIRRRGSSRETQED